MVWAFPHHLRSHHVGISKRCPNHKKIYAANKVLTMKQSNIPLTFSKKKVTAQLCTSTKSKIDFFVTFCKTRQMFYSLPWEMADRTNKDIWKWHLTTEPARLAASILIIFGKILRGRQKLLEPVWEQANLVELDSVCDVALWLGYRSSCGSTKHKIQSTAQHYSLPIAKWAQKMNTAQSNWFPFRSIFD